MGPSTPDADLGDVGEEPTAKRYGDQQRDAADLRTAENYCRQEYEYCSKSAPAQVGEFFTCVKQGEWRCMPVKESGDRDVVRSDS
jgi:hypothetical protein